MHLAGGGRGQHDLVPTGGHPPVGEDNVRPLVGNRVIGEALDRDLAGLGPSDTRVIHADDVAAATADPASTRSGAMTQPVPRTSQSTSSPGCGSKIDAAPIGIHREATIAPAMPSVAPAAAARNGAAEADATACRGVMPTARRTCRSDTVEDV